eukprot:13930169-Ditylum_brightwellii.AAC.1
MSVQKDKQVGNSLLANEKLRPGKWRSSVYSKSEVKNARGKRWKRLKTKVELEDALARFGKLLLSLFILAYFPPKCSG